MGRDFASRLQELRKEAGLTQGELANLAGLDRSMISKIESGHRQNVSSRTLKRLAKALNTSIDALLWYPAPAQDNKELARKYNLLSERFQALVDLHIDFLLHLQVTGAEDRSTVLLGNADEETELIFASPKNLQEFQEQSVEAIKKRVAESK